MDESGAIVARSAELPDPGSFVTVEHGGIPLLVVRQDDGSVRALVNICRHRGAKVELRPSGTRRMFNCPYHKWCYSRSGELRHIPFDDGFAELDRDEYALRDYPVQERDGLVLAVSSVPESAGAGVAAGAGAGVAARSEAGEQVRG
jgi:phenylpropionate dioxygenase-like ring-hydroxylating dioxygenase large terminal subunit